MCASRLWAQLLLSDSCDVSGGSSPATGFGTDGVNYQLATRLSGSASNAISYLQTATTKSATAYSITSNKIMVANAANPGRFTFSTDGVNPKNLGSVLGTPSASSFAPLQYELQVKMCNRSSGTGRTSFGISTIETGVQDWDLGIQFANNGANLDIYRRIDAASNPSGADYNSVIATLTGMAGAEVDLRLVITDAGAESGTGNFNSRYQVYANGNLVFASVTNDFRFENSTARLVLFDTAGNVGPVTYDAFLLKNLTVTNIPPSGVTNQPLKIISYQLAPGGFELTWTSAKGSNYTILRSNEINSNVWMFSTNLTAVGTNTTIIAGIDQSIANYFCVAQLSTSGLSLSNVSAAQQGSGTVDIFYNLNDLYSGTASISVLVSTDGGLTYCAPAASFSGDVGNGIRAGTNHHIVWNIGADWGSVSASNVRIKIVADRASISPDMALIPGGSFNMGNSKTEGLASESPVHAVNVSAFYANRFEVTKLLWDNVLQWATNNGYNFQSPGVATSPNHPVQQVSWYDAVKWCNARSEKEGLASAYFTDAAWTAVYRSGEINLSEVNVRWSGAGYRLATEAEWEKAARGGLDGKRFPLGDTLTQAQANYWSTAFESFDVNGAAGPHPMATQFPNILPVGSFLPSGYGLYDMAGNIWEWCWDLYGDTWYSDARATITDTRGPSSASWGGDRVYRGGSGIDIAWKSRVANRADAPPRFAMGHFGFRVVLPAGENLISAQSAVFAVTP